MFEPLNELQFETKDGARYQIYFLKFWSAEDEKDDFLVKYEIRSAKRTLFWYGRTSMKRVQDDTGLVEKKLKKPSKEVLNHVEHHLKKLFVYVMKKALDKGLKQSNMEFVFYQKPLVEMRTWKE